MEDTRGRAVVAGDASLLTPSLSELCELVGRSLLVAMAGCAPGSVSKDSETQTEGKWLSARDPKQW